MTSGLLFLPAAGFGLEYHNQAGGYITRTSLDATLSYWVWIRASNLDVLTSYGNRPGRKSVRLVCLAQ